MSACAVQRVTQDLKQRAGFGAMTDSNFVIGAGQHLEFPSLVNVALQEHQELRFVALTKAEKVNAAGDQWKHAFRRNLLADASHPQQRP